LNTGIPSALAAETGKAKTPSAISTAQATLRNSHEVPTLFPFLLAARPPMYYLPAARP
jgi:hypothetical protein